VGTSIDWQRERRALIDMVIHYLHNQSGETCAAMTS
jgi:hypothetical protein